MVGGRNLKIYGRLFWAIPNSTPLHLHPLAQMPLQVLVHLLLLETLLKYRHAQHMGYEKGDVEIILGNFRKGISRKVISGKASQGR